MVRNFVTFASFAQLLFGLSEVSQLLFAGIRINLELMHLQSLVLPGSYRTAISELSSCLT